MLFLLFAVGFCGFYVRSEAHLYCWDHAFYAQAFATLTETVVRAPVEAAVAVGRSMWFEAYNLLPVGVLVPAGAWFGTSRLVFILSIACLLALPAVAAAQALCVRVCGGAMDGMRRAALFVPMVVFAALPQFWAPVVRGYPAVGGLIFIHLTLLLYFRRSFHQQKTGHLLLMGLALASMVAFRRWYGCWAAAFLVVASLETALELARSPAHRRERLWSVGARLLTLGMAFGSFLVVFLGPRLLVMVTTDYGDRLSAYRIGTPLDSIQNEVLRVGQTFGVLPLVVFALAFFYTLLVPSLRRYTLFVVAQTTLAFGLMGRLQTLGPHHYYLVLPAVGFVVSVAAVHGIHRFERGFRLPVAGTLGIAVMVMMMGFLKVLVPSVPLPATALLPTITFPPLVRDDLAVVARLMDTLDQLLLDPDDHAYVLASSQTLNSSVLTNSHMVLPRAAKSERQLAQTHDVDKRDDFPARLLDARYVIIGRPIQYHLAPEDQLLVGIPAQQIIDGTGIGTHYQKLDLTFDLENDVKVEVYEQVEDLQPADIDALLAEFRHAYPGRAHVYRLDGL